MTPTLVSMPLSQIKLSPYQARKHFNENTLRTLAESMRHEGLIEPVVVRPVETGFELISGERRFRAARMLGWANIETKVIKTVSEAEAAAKGLIENLQRESLNPIEEAEGFSLLNRLDPKYWTQDKIAEVAGKDKSYVSRSFSLLELPKWVKDQLQHDNFSRSHAIELTRLPSPELQIEAAKQMGELSYKETQSLINSILKRKNNAKLTRKQNARVDPLQQVWETMPRNNWQVTYQAKTWNFRFKADSAEARESLVQRLELIVDALKGVPA